MKQYSVILSILFILNCSIAFSREIEIISEVVSIEKDKGYFIINAGEDSKVSLGDGAIVHRDNEEIAKAYVIEVRPDVSALELLEIEEGKEVQEYDQVLIVKELDESGPETKKTVKAPGASGKPTEWTRLTAAGTETAPAAKNQGAAKWRPLIGETQKPINTSQAQTVSNQPKSVSKWQSLTGLTQNSYNNQVQPISPAANTTPMAYTLKTTPIPQLMADKGEAVALDIKKDPSIVFSYARLVLRENGYIIESSNRASGIILATKPIELSLFKEFWSDVKSEISHNFVASIEVKNEGSSAKLIATCFDEHFQKDKHIKRPSSKSASSYQDFINTLSEIKARSEY